MRTQGNSSRGLSRWLYRNGTDDPVVAKNLSTTDFHRVGSADAVLHGNSTKRQFARADICDSIESQPCCSLIPRFLRSQRTVWELFRRNCELKWTKTCTDLRSVRLADLVLLSDVFERERTCSDVSDSVLVETIPASGFRMQQPVFATADKTQVTDTDTAFLAAPVMNHPSWGDRPTGNCPEVSVRESSLVPTVISAPTSLPYVAGRFEAKIFLPIQNMACVLPHGLSSLLGVVCLGRQIKTPSIA